MKKSVLESIRNYLNGDDTIDLSVLRDEVNAEWARMNAKRKANQDIYSMAKEVVFEVLASTDHPLTVKEIFILCEDRLPEGFSAAKIQYAMLHYWNGEVVKHDNGKSAFTYSLR